MKRFLLYFLAVLLCVSMTLCLVSCGDDDKNNDDQPELTDPDADPVDPEGDPDELPNPDDDEELDQPSGDGLEDDDSEDEDENEENNSNNSGGNNNKPNYNDGGINLPFVPAS